MGKYKAAPRYNVISMRISDSELQTVQAIASYYAISKSEVMRQVMERFTISHDGSGIAHGAERWHV